MRSAMKNALDLINRQQAEIERLNGYINTNCLDCAGCKQWKCDCSNIKAEATKEFTELLKTKFDQYGAEHYYYSLVDNVAKEVVGEYDNSHIVDNRK